MALIVPGRFLYLHVPKTGGRWVKHVLRANLEGAALLRTAKHEGSWARHGHPDLQDLQEHDPIFRFAFVRNPVDFWRSFWRFRMAHGWVPEHEIDSRCADNDFGAFVDKVIASLPGYASRMFSRFVGEPGREIEFIGRQERLQEDLVAALTAAGMDVSRLNLSVPRVNAGGGSTSDVRFTAAQRSALEDAEREGMDRFGYAA